MSYKFAWSIKTELQSFILFCLVHNKVQLCDKLLYTSKCIILTVSKLYLPSKLQPVEICNRKRKISWFLNFWISYFRLCYYYCKEGKYFFEAHDHLNWSSISPILLIDLINLIDFEQSRSDNGCKVTGDNRSTSS